MTSVLSTKPVKINKKQWNLDLSFDSHNEIQVKTKNNNERVNVTGSNVFNKLSSTGILLLVSKVS